jgi:hypothetical protein
LVLIMILGTCELIIILCVFSTIFLGFLGLMTYSLLIHLEFFVWVGGNGEMLVKSYRLSVMRWLL